MTGRINWHNLLLRIRRINWRNLLLKATWFKVIGVSVMLYGFGIMYVMISVLHWNKLFAYVIQAVTSVLLSSSLNRYVTWRERKVRLHGALARAASVWAVTIPMNTLLFAVWSAFGIPYPVAQFINVVLIAVLRFVGFDRYVFREKRPNGPEQEEVAGDR